MIKIQREHDEPIELNVESLKGIKLKGFCFHRCLLNELDFRESELSNADFRSAELNNTLCNDSLLKEAKLIMVNAKESFFENCNFESALILHSNFNNSKFNGSNFKNATIKNVDFTGCDLRGVCFDCEGLETCIFTNALYDDKTIWKGNFALDEFGAIKIESDEKIHEKYRLGKIK